MATQSDEPTQPTSSANTENFYITEADQFVVNELLTKFDTYSSFCFRLPPRDQHLLDSRVWLSNVMVCAFLNGLKIVTFNCHGFKSSVYDILLLCEQFDVIILQELWLSSEDIPIAFYS